MYPDKVGSSLRVITLCAFLSAVMVLAIWLPINCHNSLGELVVFVVLFGFVFGAFVSLMSPALIEVAGGHTHDLGVMLGTFFAIVAVASLTGLPAQGAIADGGDNIVGLIIFCGVVMLVGCAALVSAKEKKRKAAEAEH